MEEGSILVSIMTLLSSSETWLTGNSRPKEFVKVSSYEESDDEESTVGKMPPSDDSDSET
jgi:probable RNA-binding protein EIF1AD